MGRQSRPHLPVCQGDPLHVHVRGSTLIVPPPHRRLIGPFGQCGRSAALTHLEESDRGEGANHVAPEDTAKARAHAGMSTGGDDRSADVIGEWLVLK